MQTTKCIDVGLLTGGQDRHYAYGLATGLMAREVCLDIIGSDAVDCPTFHDPPRARFLNLQGDRSREARLPAKIARVTRYYGRLIRYAYSAKPELFHILWNNKFETLDRTLLMAYYRLLGKKIVFTAHNVNIGKRDATDSLLNRLTLAVQYRLSHHIFVHTPAMKAELVNDFGVNQKAVTVIPYGINNAVPDTDLSSAEAKRRLGLGGDDRAILFFGAIAPYKGLDLLVEAFKRLDHGNARYRLIIAGLPKGGCDQYLRDIQETIRRDLAQEQVIQKIEYIPDEETELYFKGADLLALPYRDIFQSGILFLAYNFGMPVVATDVGSFKEDILEGRTGLVCRRNDPEDMARAMAAYFRSDLFREPEKTRRAVRDRALERHSWDRVGDITRDVYQSLLET